MSYDVIKTDNAFQCFQAGFTAAAVSMRARAIKVVQENCDPPQHVIDTVINMIGELPDIPESV